MAAEVTREQCFLRLHQEAPYELAVETERWARTKKNERRVEQIIYVSRAGQKALVIGQGGRTIKAIGVAAGKELSEMLGEKVHLFLHVKVRKNWQDDPVRLKRMGFEHVE